MKKIKNWKTIFFLTVVSFLIATQPIIAFACETTSSHCGG